MLRKSILAATVLSLGALAISGCAVEAEDDIRVSEQEIIQGDTVPFASEESRGVVQVTGWNVDGDRRLCTGTLLTNSHVLTARHCVRKSPGSGSAWNTNALHTGLSVDFQSSAGTVSSAVSSVEEPTTLNQNAALDDFAVLTLETPIVVNGSDRDFANRIHPGTPFSLNGEAVFCLGYGVNAEAYIGGNNRAVAMTGSGVLRSGDFVISDSSNTEFTIEENSDGQVAAPGDSGSSCFLGNGQIAGVASFVTGFSYFDVNGNGVQDGDEIFDIQNAIYTAPTAYRDFAQDITDASLTISYSFLPSLESNSALDAFISSPLLNSSRQLGSGTTDKSVTVADAATRSGYIDVELEEPPRMMCERVSTVAPLSGEVQVVGTCLGDGLVSAIL